MANIHEEEVLEAVAIKIQECHTAPHGLQQEPVWRLPAKVLPGNSRLLRHITEKFRLRRRREILGKAQRDRHKHDGEGENRKESRSAIPLATACAVEPLDRRAHPNRPYSFNLSNKAASLAPSSFLPSER